MIECNSPARTLCASRDIRDSNCVWHTQIAERTPGGLLSCAEEDVIGIDIEMCTGLNLACGYYPCGGASMRPKDWKSIAVIGGFVVVAILYAYRTREETIAHSDPTIKYAPSMRPGLAEKEASPHPTQYIIPLDAELRAQRALRTMQPRAAKEQDVDKYPQ